MPVRKVPHGGCPPAHSVREPHPRVQAAGPPGSPERAAEGFRMFLEELAKKKRPLR